MLLCTKELASHPNTSLPYPSWWTVLVRHQADPQDRTPPFRWGTASLPANACLWTSHSPMDCLLPVCQQQVNSSCHQHICQPGFYHSNDKQQVFSEYSVQSIQWQINSSCHQCICQPGFYHSNDKQQVFLWVFGSISSMTNQIIKSSMYICKPGLYHSNDKQQVFSEYSVQSVQWQISSSSMYMQAWTLSFRW